LRKASEDTASQNKIPPKRRNFIKSSSANRVLALRSLGEAVLALRSLGEAVEMAGVEPASGNFLK